MKLTKKKALEICIELWTWLAKTGKEKEDWDGWKKYGEMECDCPFCEYGRRKHKKMWGRCEECPIVLRSDWYGCYQMGYDKWSEADNDEDRSVYAKIFLERLLEIK